jgi:hypothetical protein
MVDLEGLAESRICCILLKVNRRWRQRDLNSFALLLEVWAHSRISSEVLKSEQAPMLILLVTLQKVLEKDTMLTFSRL